MIHSMTQAYASYLIYGSLLHILLNLVSAPYYSYYSIPNHFALAMIDNSEKVVYIPDTMSDWPWLAKFNPLCEEFEAESIAWLASFQPHAPESQNAHNKAHEEDAHETLPGPQNRGGTVGRGVGKIADRLSAVDDPDQLRLGGLCAWLPFAGAAVAGHYDHQFRWRSEVLVVGDQPPDWGVRAHIRTTSSNRIGLLSGGYALIPAERVV
ncbi:hypothetical protein LXA43DRAFT_1068593 [Ganoderma leucocontextum]|nr:hypothetical protein LXA43DRAFT_1068593 [Ganoderma leucocontextum]